MTTVTPEFLEQLLATGNHPRTLQAADVGVALDARGLDPVGAQQRLGPVVHLTGRLLRAVHRGALSLVAGCAAELLRRMLAEDQLALRVGGVRLRHRMFGAVLEAGLVDA